MQPVTDSQPVTQNPNRTIKAMSEGGAASAAEAAAGSKRRKLNNVVEIKVRCTCGRGFHQAYVKRFRGDVLYNNNLLSCPGGLFRVVAHTGGGRK